MNSLARASCYEVVALSVLQRNISYGPYNHGGNLQTLWETGLAMMKQLNPDDSFLCKLWPRICRDRGWTTEEQCGRQARVKFLEVLPAFRPFSVKGPRAAPSKWVSVLKAITHEKRDATLKMMGIAFMAVKKGWVDDVDAFLNPPCKLSVMRDQSMAKRFPEEFAPIREASSSSGSGAGAPAASPAAGPEPVPSRAKAKAKAKARITNMIAKDIHTGSHRHASVQHFELDVSMVGKGYTRIAMWVSTTSYLSD